MYMLVPNNCARFTILFPHLKTRIRWDWRRRPWPEIATTAGGFWGPAWFKLGKLLMNGFKINPEVYRSKIYIRLWLPKFVEEPVWLYWLKLTTNDIVVLCLFIFLDTSLITSQHLSQERELTSPGGSSSESVGVGRDSTPEDWIVNGVWYNIFVLYHSVWIYTYTYIYI